MVTPTDEELKRMRRGAVLTEITQRDEPGGAARVQAVFQGAAERVWELLEDCSANRRFVRGLEECSLLENRPRSARSRHVIKAGWYLPRMEFLFDTVREPHLWIRIFLESGDLSELRGSWRFDPLPDDGGLLVTHEIRLVPRFAAPRWLVRRTLLRDLPDMIACLRWVANASPNERSAKRDATRCPDGSGNGAGASGIP